MKNELVSLNIKTKNQVTKIKINEVNKNKWKDNKTIMFKRYNKKNKYQSYFINIKI
jgi:sulfate adenylyltransferase subunit 1 (EFTu-like GTPase family)